MNDNKDHMQTNLHHKEGSIVYGDEVNRSSLLNDIVVLKLQGNGST